MKKFLKETVSGFLMLFGLWLHLNASELISEEPWRFWLAVAGVISFLLGIDMRIALAVKGRAGQ